MGREEVVYHRHCRLQEGRATDAELVECLIRRCPRAWRRFEAQYRLPIRAAIQKSGRIWGRVFTTEELEDLQQDVFLRLTADNDRLFRMFDRKRGRLHQWIQIIARSTAIDYLRKPLLQTTPLDEVDEIRDRQNGFLVTQGQDDIEHLKRLLRDILSPRELLVLSLLVFDESSPEEVAGKLEISRKTVDVHKFKAVKKLRRLSSNRQQNRPLFFLIA